MSSIIDLGVIRASDKHIIQLSSYDPYPSVGPSYYRFTADVPWAPYTSYVVGDWIIYYPEGTFFNGYWNAAGNAPTLENGSPVSSGTYYIVNAPGRVNFGAGSITFQLGDLVVYDGSIWSKVSGKEVTRICNQTHQSTGSYNLEYWDRNNVPPYYELDKQSGALYADLPYLPYYSNTYIFTIRIDKYDVLRADYGYVNQQFKLIIKGQIDNPLSFDSPANLGTLNLGYLSELSIVAVHQTGNLSTRYSIIEGSLPPGLTLGIDGSIIGRVDYTADLGPYYFTVRATDLYAQIVEKTFFITVSKYDDLKYTQIYVKPFLLRDVCYTYSVFITDPTIFEPSKIYRNSDPYFGVQQELRLYLEYGIQQVRLTDYIEAMSQCFVKKKLLFGDVKTAPAEDDFGNYLYDVVYVEIIDPLQDQDGNYVESSLKYDIKVYPNSIANMRRALSLVEYDDQFVKIDEYQMPLWMRTPQRDTGLPLGYTLSAVLCYALPNTGSSIVRNIRNSKFNFNIINFEIDRIIIENNLNINRTCYLPFSATANTQLDLSLAEQQVITSFVLGESLPLTDDNGNPIII